MQNKAYNVYFLRELTGSDLMQKCHHKHDMNILCILRTLQPFCEIFRVETHTLSTQHITTSSTTYRDAVSGIWM